MILLLREEARFGSGDEGAAPDGDQRHGMTNRVRAWARGRPLAVNARSAVALVVRPGA